MKNERKKRRFALRIAAILLLACGVAFLAAGVTDVVRSAIERAQPKKFWTLVVGFASFAVGWAAALAGFYRDRSKGEEKSSEKKSEDRSEK